VRAATPVLLAATALVGAMGALPAGAGTDAGGRVRPATIEFLGQAIVPTGTMFEGTVVGGLSSITYDAKAGRYYAISDDPGVLGPVRYYTLGLDVADGDLEDGDVTFLDVTTLLAPDGSPYPPSSLDPEGLTLTKDRELVVTSEGLPLVGIAPWVRCYSRDGTYLGDLPVPDVFAPNPTVSGVRPNLGFEAAAVSPDGRHLFVGAEGAVYQDGPAASVLEGSRARVLRYHLRTGRVERQYVYETDPVAEPPVPPTQFSVNGLVELLPFNTQFMLAMERSFSVGAPGTGNTIKLYRAEVGRADDVSGIPSLDGLTVRPMRKTLLLDLRTLGIPLDNVEGMVLGPRLADGRQSLILVSDNNFAATQFTQFLLFALP
jgi:hypothetical protein